MKLNIWDWLLMIGFIGINILLNSRWENLFISLFNWDGCYHKTYSRVYIMLWLSQICLMVYWFGEEQIIYIFLQSLKHNTKTVLRVTNFKHSRYPSETLFKESEVLSGTQIYIHKFSLILEVINNLYKQKSTHIIQEQKPQT